MVLLLIGFLLGLEVKKNHDKGKVITQLQLDNQRLDSIKNENGKTIQLQDAIITSNQESLSALTDSIFNLKSKHEKQIKQVIAYYKGVTVTNIDSVLIPYVDSAQLAHKDSLIQGCREVMKVLLDSFIFVPRRVEAKTPQYRFAGTVLKEGFRIDSLQIPDTLQLRFVEKKSFLKRPSYQVQFFHSNPLITNTQANSIIYKPPKKPRVLEKALLIGAGIFLGSKL